MKYQDLIELMDRLDQSSLAYIEYLADQEKIILSKEVPAAPVALEASSTQSSLSVVSPATDVTDSGQTSVLAEASVATDQLGEEVLAPMVGVVYLQPEPSADQFVQVGDRVKKGQVVCIIEAMKLMNEIQAPYDGVVTEILVANEEVVEYNQAIIRIDTSK